MRITQKSNDLAMDLMPELSHIFTMTLLTLYLLCFFGGVYGFLWLSDEWDEYKKILMGYFGIPFTFLFFYKVMSYLHEFRMYKTPIPLQLKVYALFLILLYSPGLFLLANATTGYQKPVKSLVVSDVSSNGLRETIQYRGRFGVLYKKRW